MLEELLDDELLPLELGELEECDAPLFELPLEEPDDVLGGELVWLDEDDADEDEDAAGGGAGAEEVERCAQAADQQRRLTTTTFKGRIGLASW